jgi:hypothetical protein
VIGPQSPTDIPTERQLPRAGESASGLTSTNHARALMHIAVALVGARAEIDISLEADGAAMTAS